MASRASAAAAAAATTSASSNVNGVLDPSHFSTTSALVSYLRLEASMAEEKAKRLRAQADMLAAQHGITDDDLHAYNVLGPSELAPLDGNGRPKYKGKKRGRKPKEKKRKHDPNREKRKHTGYTLFMQETYPIRKAEHPDLQSKELISMVARQWKEELVADEKEGWKTRAAAMSNAESVAEATTAAEREDDADDGGGDPVPSTGGKRRKVGGKRLSRLSATAAAAIVALPDDVVAAAAAAAARDADEDDEEDRHGDEDDDEEGTFGEDEEEDYPPARKSKLKGEEEG